MQNQERRNQEHRNEESGITHANITLNIELAPRAFGDALNVKHPGQVPGYPAIDSQEQFHRHTG
ncbi:MAG: hypothetical protein K9I85_07500 [Saprospiraceae bacterium]|nr:hypothetical protein [Saprospiraceae bacterium]